MGIKTLLNICCAVAMPFWAMPIETAFPRDSRPLEPGGNFPQISMQSFADEMDSNYLGLGKERSFSISDIKADLILVEIMNTNCISCRKQAPVYNELFSMIAADRKIKSKIKMIGIAVGNNDTEIQAFKEELKTPFPIVADPNFQIWDVTGRSRTPLSVMVRQQGDGKPGVVASVHLGLQSEAKAVLKELKLLMKENPTPWALQTEGHEKGTPQEPTPVYSDQRLLELMAVSFFKAGFFSERIEAVQLPTSGRIFVSTGRRDGTLLRLFAKPYYRFLPCDACHDAQMLIIFEGSGKIVDLIPLQLTKAGNQPFSETDLSKIRDRVLGKYIFAPFQFKADVDAVAGATITSSVIFKTLNEGEALFEELKAAGMLSVKFD